MNHANSHTWKDWTDIVEKTIGRSLDGDQDQDGYSLDIALQAWHQGESPEEYAKKLTEAIRTLNKDRAPFLAHVHKSKVWIELQRLPDGYFENDVSPDQKLKFRQNQAAAGNKILAAIKSEGSKAGTIDGMHFWWDETKNTYCLTLNDSGLYIELPGSGSWIVVG
jgi:hypothetical protein